MHIAKCISVLLLLISFLLIIIAVKEVLIEIFKKKINIY